MSEREAIRKALKANIDLAGFFNEILDSIVEESLKEIVEDTSTPLDDMVYNAIYPMLEQKMKAKLVKLQEKLYEGI